MAMAGTAAVAGLAVLLAAAAQPELKAKLELTAESRVVVVICEGATDPETYHKCVGRSVTAVNASKFYSALSTEARGMKSGAVRLPEEPFKSTYQRQVPTKPVMPSVTRAKL